MKHILLFEELTGKYKEETEIIYKDKSIICIIPKSQMTSSIYGYKTNWCQTTNHGFCDWSGRDRPDKLALLIRFIFKDGKKIRFTYWGKDDKFYWANEKGWHVLEGNGNPFNVKMREGKRESDMESDILSRINEIPEECKISVLKFIEKNKKSYKYIYTDKEYTTTNIQNLLDDFKRIRSEVEEKIKKLSHKNILISTYFDKKQKEFEISYLDDSSNNKRFYEKEKFKDIKSFEKRLHELIDSLNDY